MSYCDVSMHCYLLSDPDNIQYNEKAVSYLIYGDQTTSSKIRVAVRIRSILLLILFFMDGQCGFDEIEFSAFVNNECILLSGT
jgi:hypothetical protein